MSVICDHGIFTSTCSVCSTLMQPEDPKVVINKFEDHYFKRVLGAYIHPELKGLFESNGQQRDKINLIKEEHRNSEEYKIGLKWFMIRQPEIDGFKWHYTQLKSSFIGEVAEQIKKISNSNRILLLVKRRI